MKTRTRPISELEAELEQAREVEEADRAATESAERQRLIARKMFEREMEPRVATVEKRAQEAAVGVKAAAKMARPPYAYRVTARAYLRGQLIPDALRTPEHLVSDIDSPAAFAFAVAVEARGLLAAMCGPEAPVRLVGSEVVERCDAAEAVAHAAFIARVRVLASET